MRPGTYFNPQTEVLIVVDDSSSMDNEIFNLEEFEGADWVLVSDDCRSTRPSATSCSRTSRPPTTAATAARPASMDDPDADDDAPLDGRERRAGPADEDDELDVS